MLELFSSIPAVYLDLTQDIVDDAEPVSYTHLDVYKRQVAR